MHSTRTEEIAYALSKQLRTAHTIESNYGPIALDEELQQAVYAALRPIFERRLSKAARQQATGGKQ